MEICKCGHLRKDHKISSSSCKQCKCELYQWDISLKKYQDTIQKIIENNPPQKSGGCFIATRELTKAHPEIIERVFDFSRNIYHCVGVLLDGRIIDTQMFQLSLIADIKEKEYTKIVFSPKEFQNIMNRGN